VTRNAVNLVRTEMAMIEPRGIVVASADSLMVRLPYATGIYCGANTVTFAPVDSLVGAQAVYAGYAYRDTTSGAVTTYVPNGGDSLTNGAAATCTGNGITPVPNGRVLVLSPNYPVATIGTPVLLYQTVTYKFAASTLVSGRTALWRRVAGGANEEIAVPFGTGSRFRFFVSGGVTPTDTVPTLLRNMGGLEVALMGESERTSPGTGLVESEPTRVSIFFRNAVQ